MEKASEDYKFFQLVHSQKLSEELFKKFAELVYKESGITLKDSKITLLSNRLRKRLLHLHIPSYEDYFKYLQGQIKQGKLDELVEFLDVVSTNESYFFRNMRHFDTLKQYIIPDLMKINENTKHIKVWSAGCSTGEEPYTIAMIFNEVIPSWNVEIIATDISQSALNIAKKGYYVGRTINKVPEYYLKKYFTPYKSGYKIKDSIKRYVKFGIINLFKDPYPTNLDIIFCRNVMIYFDKKHQKQLIEGFYNVIKPTGYLFVGHSETLYMLSEDFIYKKIGEAPVYLPVKNRKKR